MQEPVESLHLYSTKPTLKPRTDFINWIFAKTKTKNLKNLSELTKLDYQWLGGIDKNGHTKETLRRHRALAKAAGVTLEDYFERLLEE